MENNLLYLFKNPILMPALTGWAAAQLLKVLLIFLIQRKLDMTRFVGAGGMPSAHSAFVVAMATSLGLRYGWDSAVFAVGAALAMVVMYDAAGVRRAAGKQAARINEIIETLIASDKGLEFKQEQLRELLGHTPMEVLAGALLGIAIAVAFCL